MGKEGRRGEEDGRGGKEGRMQIGGYVCRLYAGEGMRKGGGTGRWVERGVRELGWGGGVLGRGSIKCALRDGE